LFRVSKTKSINEFCEYLDYLKKTAKLEGNLKKLNINLESTYERIISGVILFRLKNNSVKITHLDIKKILYSINT